MTLGQLCPGIDLSRCTEIRRSYTLLDLDSNSVSLTPENPGFDALLAQFQDRTFRRSVRGLLSSGGTKSLSGYSDKGTRWEVYLNFDNTVTLPRDEETSSVLIWFDNFYGAVDLHYAGKTALRALSTADKQQWLLEVQALLSDTATG